MPTPTSASYPSAPSAYASAYPSASAGSAGSYPGLAEYMGLELTEAEVRANMPEYLPAVVQVQKPQDVSTKNFFMLSHHRAAALPLFLDPAWLPPYLASLLAWPKHR